MTNTAIVEAPSQIHATRDAAGALVRTLVIGLTAFLTVVDLFATQAILPSLTAAYRVSPAAMGFAVNASTMGMAAAGLLVAFFSRRIDRRRGILLSLTLLAVPTALLALAPNLTVFTLLRIGQGVFMSSAFTLTLAYLGEECSAKDAAGAFAAYITGNVASNLFGRLMSAAVADHLGLAANFYVFALLNLSGALLVYFTLGRATPMPMAAAGARAPFSIWAEHLRNASLRASFAIGFCILFAFIGTFTYVNFVLVREPFGLGMMSLGFVYFVFLPSIVTTPIAGEVTRRLGTRPTLWGSLALAGLGLPLLLVPSLAAVLVGLVLVGVGTFFAQATATGFVGRAATTDRGSASGLYLASYFLGGLVGSAVLGQAFDRLGWGACVAGVGAALALAAALATRLKMPLAAAGPARSGAMKSAAAAVVLVGAVAAAPMASAAPADEVRATYEAFAAAQNAHDLAKVRTLLLDSPKFLWVSDGMSIWGRDAVLRRMALFQELEVWRVEPDLAKAVPAEAGEGAAFLHLPLALVIGKASAPETLRFLFSVLCVRTTEGWRIAALFTTTEKPG
jgi:MFS transporter, YNFM family, putative membrane transport protein